MLIFVLREAPDCLKVKDSAGEVCRTLKTQPCLSGKPRRLAADDCRGRDHRRPGLPAAGTAGGRAWIGNGRGCRRPGLPAAGIAGGRDRDFSGKRATDRPERAK